MKEIIQWTGERRRRLYWGFLWSFLASMFTAMPIMGAAYGLQLMLEDQAGRRTLTPEWALYMLLFMLVMILGRFVFSYLRAVFQESIGHEVTAQQRSKIGEILKRVSLGFFDKNSTGELATSVTTDLSYVEMYAMKMIDVVVNGYISTAAMVLCLWFYSWQIALLALGGVLLSFVFLTMLEFKSRSNASAHQQAMDQMAASTLEYVRGIAVVKAYGQEGAAIRGIRKAYKSCKDINVKIEADYVLPNCLHLLSLKLVSIAIVVLAAFLCKGGSISIPTFLMFSVFSFVIFGHVEQVNNAAHVLEIIKTVMEKTKLIERAEFPDPATPDKTLHDFTIEMQHVTFAYDARPVLKDVSFRIPQNTTTAIVGPSGSGKSTICSLLARFYDVKEGRILVGGTDIRTMSCDSLLKNISMVFQQVYLFHDTIENNIRFGKTDASMEEIVEAAQKARCHSFIEALPQGYQTMVGEGGATLSGGEKQRISIARAILKDAPIIILDEATASIDPENEHHIQEAISALTRGKTMLVIAHRMATIEHADQILVLEDGRVVQQGTHETLSRQSGLYRRFADARRRAEGWELAVKS
ncbi:MAG: ABC transporter ATP-binding protein [Lachnospiraceae bacterium]